MIQMRLLEADKFQASPSGSVGFALPQPGRCSAREHSPAWSARHCRILLKVQARAPPPYDAANGRPTAEQLPRDYLDAGSVGLPTLARLKNVTRVRIHEASAKNPKIFSDAKRCLSASREGANASTRTDNGHGLKCSTSQRLPSEVANAPRL